MSCFPNPEEFSQKISLQHHGAVPIPVTNFVFKKHKGVYLYDLDENKFIDFSLQSGEIFGGHSPSRLSKFLKNALSSGFGHASAYNKFLYNAQRVWQRNLHTDSVTFYTDPIQAIVTVLSTMKTKETIGVDTLYLEKTLAPLSCLMKIINVQNNPQKVGLFLTEKDTKGFREYEKKIFVLSRFLFRGGDPDHEEVLLLNFEGMRSAISSRAYPQQVLTPQEGMFFLEGGKYFQQLKQKQFRQFSHPMIENHTYYGIPKKSLDPHFFLKHGIFLEKDILYFSPEHTVHNYRRLSQVLDIFFNI